MCAFGHINLSLAHTKNPRCKLVKKNNRDVKSAAMNGEWVVPCWRKRLRKTSNVLVKAILLL